MHSPGRVLFDEKMMNSPRVAVELSLQAIEAEVGALLRALHEPAKEEALSALVGDIAEMGSKLIGIAQTIANREAVVKPHAA
jgi:hypothetical protein